MTSKFLIVAELDYAWNCFPFQVTWSKDQTLRLWEIGKSIKFHCQETTVENGTNIIGARHSLSMASTLANAPEVERYDSKIGNVY